MSSSSAPASAASPAPRRSAARRSQVTVVDRRNYHLFVPLLYQVATAALSPADIARPIRRILSRYKNIDVVLGDVTGVDIAAPQGASCATAPTLPYDRLVVATGSNYTYFGHDEWARGRARPEDDRGRAPHPRAAAARLRARRDRRAIRPSRIALITTIIVGGGPTGVEMAGSVVELARHALARDFRSSIRPRRAVILVEAGPRILPTFPETLADLREERRWRSSASP